MSTRMRKELAYHASLEEVARMVRSTDFREQVLEAQQVLRGSVSIDRGTVRIEQVQAADGIPSFAKKFVGDEIVIVQEEEWSSPRRGEVRVTIPGKPGEMTGTATLESRGDTTVETVELSIKVSIPLVSGKIETLIADMLRKALDAEHRTGQVWLRQHRGQR